MAILVTGGTGFIGSHTCVELLNSGYELVVIDNLLNSKIEVINRIKEITGKEFTFYEVNLLNMNEIGNVFEKHEIHAVIHFAGLKDVEESVIQPLKYYQTNIIGTLNLCEVMNQYDVYNLVFSSSATVYGTPDQVPITEDFPLRATNPYGRSKQMIEQILSDLHMSNNKWSVALLRYFNPVGAHESGFLGENPTIIPNNLMYLISQVAAGKLEHLNVFGNDYETLDGTVIRDYIHVMDLAKGHMKALENVMFSTGIESYNLGTGKGHSVLEIVNTFEQVAGKTIPYVIKERRPEEVAICYVKPDKSKQRLYWTAEKTLEDMCMDTWRWQSMSPSGYTNAKYVVK